MKIMIYNHKVVYIIIMVTMAIILMQMFNLLDL